MRASWVPLFTLYCPSNSVPRECNRERNSHRKQNILFLAPSFHTNFLSQHFGTTLGFFLSRHFCVLLPEVGKMKTFYLRPIPLLSTQQVDDIDFVFKKRRVARPMLTTFGKVEVENTIFDFGFLTKFDIRQRDQQ